jgi:acyl-coenzyme A thioesterase PaaI-like protein
MAEIQNPFIHLEGYNCFGCAPGNTNGLKMTFREDGEELISSWNPLPFYQGYHNLLHGGIQATLMDEIASWTVFVKVKVTGVTSKAEIRYRKPVDVTKGPLSLRAKLVAMRRNLADIEVKLYDCNDQLCADGFFTFFTFPDSLSRESMYAKDPGQAAGK